MRIRLAAAAALTGAALLVPSSAMADMAAETPSPATTTESENDDSSGNWGLLGLLGLAGLAGLKKRKDNQPDYSTTRTRDTNTR
ncbi:WGxxGxxG family protein [Knoellia sp. CPCC 206435]|uniref:WGxxGxxG family protein n=1 Tax=Knoellia terrae TaxID=3404797 RepID=UPI003B42EEC8